MGASSEVLGHGNGSFSSVRVGPSRAEGALFPNGDRSERLCRLMHDSTVNSIDGDSENSQIILRQALILAAKLSRQNAANYDPRKASPLCHRSADVGMMLTLANMPREVVVAGFLHNALEEVDGAAYEQRREVIERKFIKKGGLNSSVLHLVEQVYPIDEAGLSLAEQERRQLARIERSGPHFAALLCAVKASEIENMKAAPPEDIFEFERLFSAHRVPPIIRDQFRVAVKSRNPEVDLLTFGVDSDGLKSPLSTKDVMFIRNGMQLSSRFFSREVRTRGLGETVPLNSHSCEVGYLLLSAGQDKEMVVAGLCHDFEEQYVRKANVNKLRQYIGKHFGPRVLRLIHAVSEPPKSGGTSSWLQRKESVLHKVAADASDEATLCCAAKISTFGNGNKWLKACLKAGEKDIEAATLRWSKGNHTENLTFAMRLLDVFEQKHVPQLLLEQYEHEVRRFLRFRRLYEQTQA